MKYAKIIFTIMLLSLFSCSNDPGKDGADATSDMVQADRFNSLITITDEEPGENCEVGGKRIDTGLDNGGEDGIENDGILQGTEIDSTEYVCNGVNGLDGTAGESGQGGNDGVDGSNGQDGINGADGVDGSDGIDGQDGQDGSDSTNDIAIVYNLSGKSQKGRCLKGGEILVWPLIDGTLTQLGTHFIGFTGENGSYNIRAETNEKYALVCFKGWCDDEANGGTTYQEMCGIRKTSDPFSNINPLTKINIPVTEWLFDSGFGNVEESLIEAERLTTEFLSMPETERFSTMNLENDSITDAVLALSSSMILKDRTDAESRDYMVSIATGIINNDLNLKAEILTAYDQLPLIAIKNNLESSYASVGVEIKTPPFWRLKAPAYYADLLERDPVVISIYNLTDNTTCSFDQSVFNLFAVPHVFDSAIETSRYIALNFPPDANISVWTVGVDRNGKPAPGVKLLDIEGLREIILNNPVKLSYNGFLGDDHGLTAGIWYYLRIRKDENFTLSKGCGGTHLYTYYSLASKDEGINWIGDGINSGKFFYFSGIKMYTTD